MVQPSRARHAELWIAAAILLVLLSGLLLGGDARRGVGEFGRDPAKDPILMTPRPADVALLLKNTPLAIAPQDALVINAARPVDAVRVNPAKPFVLPRPLSAQDVGATTALDCLTKAIYYEAAVENETGQRAVAQVILNRMRSPIFPNSVCGVVFQGSELRTGCQFSFTCDGSLQRQPSLAGWMRARRVALAALSGVVERSVGLATHYHANYVVPYWASSLDKVSTIGAHIFYAMRGGLGRPGAFSARYDRLGEAAPTPQLEIDPIAELGLPGDGSALGMPDLKPRDRTLVQEDALGAPLRPGSAVPVPTPTLRADEAKGEIVADQSRGVLNQN